MEIEETVEAASAWSKKAMDILLEWGPKIVLAIVVLVVGIIIINAFVRGIRKVMNKRNVDPSLVPFFTSLINVLLKVVLLITVIDIVGIKTTSFVAILGAAGLAVGLALQGSLANFAGGVLILIFKPYKVGDYITAQGQSGTVKAIQIFNTILTTPDNVRVIIPNGGLSSGTITNYSAEENRRIDLVFGIGYDDNIDQARQVLADIAAADERIFKDPAPFIVVKELGDSSVNLLLRIWCKAGDYWDLNFEMQAAVKKKFDAASLTIPYPQTDVHLHQK